MNTKPIIELIEAAKFALTDFHLADSVIGIEYSLRVKRLQAAIPAAERAMAQEEANARHNATLDRFTTDAYGSPGTRKALRLADNLTAAVNMNRFTATPHADDWKAIMGMAREYRAERGLE